ncbi:hypothetical protein SAMN05920897_101214 [Alkalispirochaeta americana]|uniref:Uncharacterized protein n=1 Tax=Alkalispirochaeta americana TaxID=159291 RepID=A0A1N6NEF1_9SPIO|nr:hypothetical protein [Alkalispirochaeta americana]SIP90432.1 hypothetical protein SAMN05920897_101214 [Alkalispirochaeta americana]
MSRRGVFRTCRTLAVLLVVWGLCPGVARADTALQDREPLRVRSLRDETTRTVVGFFGPPSEVAPRATLASRDFLETLCPDDERLVAWLVNPEGKDLPLHDFSPRVQDYLPRELEEALSGARGFTAAYGVVPASGSARGEDDPREIVLFYRNKAFTLFLYHEEGARVDGEVLPRQWTRRRSLASGWGY